MSKHAEAVGFEDGSSYDAASGTARSDVVALPAWRSIMELGRLAPTPHNTQWYFVHVVDSQTAHVCIDVSIAIPFTDPNDQFRYTGLGVFTRHLELAARAVGFEMQTTFDDLDASGPVTARIVGRRPVDEGLAAFLRTRQTSRFAYGEEPLSAAAIQGVQALTDRRTTLVVTTDPEIVQAVLELNNEILLDDLQDRGTSRELDSWIRYTERSRRRHQNGFTPASLASPAWKIWMVFRLRSLLRFTIVRRWLTAQYLAQNRAATVGWISGPLATHDDQFRAGRTLMDAWMTLTEHGYYLQPYGSVITDDAARARLLRTIGVAEAPNELVWMIFRAGTSPPPPRSLRKPVEEYLR
jgi:hypothetical protein